MSSLKDRLALAMQGPPVVSAADIARACKIKPPSVSDWVTGRTKTIRGENLLVVAALLQVKPKWLQSGVGPRRDGATALKGQWELALTQAIASKDWLAVQDVLDAMQAHRFT